MKAPEYFTWEEWRIRGYVINKGMKSTLRNKDNIPLFSEFQVKLKPMRRCDYSDDLDYDDSHWSGLTDDWD